MKKRSEGLVQETSTVYASNMQLAKVIEGKLC